MPPVQRTFTIIPQGRSLASNGAGDSAPIRPMTSKQVRKAYKAANKAPPMSKAERIKQEKAEQERIRKEFEKEKTAARAKAARDRKRDKENAEKEEKKKKRQPLVTVRPSQDTISWFVRGNGSGKKRDCAGRGIEEEKAPEAAPPPSPIAEESEEEQMPEMPPIKDPTQEEPLGLEKVPDNEKNSDPPPECLTTQLDIVDFQMMDNFDVGSGAPSEKQITGDSVAVAAIIKNPEPRPPNGSVEMLDDLDVGIRGDANKPPDGETITITIKENLEPNPQIPRLEQKSLPELDLISEEDDFELEMLALEAMTQKQLSRKSNPKLNQRSSQKSSQRSSQKHKKCNLTPNNRPNPTRRSTSFERDLGLDVKGLLDTSVTKHRSNRPPDRKFLIPPPPPPPRRRSPSPRSPIAQRPQLPPLSTQAIFSNLDDFFPTSSQLALELEEDTEFLTPKPKPSALKPTPASKSRSPYRSPEILSPETPSESPTPKKRFFTSSGNNEMLALALHRSRRDAALEELGRKEDMRLEVGMIAQMEKEAEKKKQSAIKVERPKPKIMNTMNQPRPLLHLAEKKLAAIREANKKASPKDAKRMTQWNPNKMRPIEVPKDIASKQPKAIPPIESKVTPMKASRHIPPQGLKKQTPIQQQSKTIPPLDKQPGPPTKPLGTPMLTDANKENIAPPPAADINAPGSNYLSASQETEYGGIGLTKRRWNL
ncbi:hypothetical protein PT974_04863 [Cladobotryum mycophilum]|uniref:Uncharacterized protein n=1 Tax=Cladobotryum mycophilum TaxID=491253 RepID=A0ABR0SQD2_9HYPO